MGLHDPSSSSGGRSFFGGFWSAALRRKAIGIATDSVAGHGGGLVRHLGLFELILLGIGASIGAGIFVVTGTVARDAGPGVTISFALAGAACVLNALCYAELSSRFPAVVGGAYLYTYAAFNELMAFLVFTQLMLDYHIGAASIARSLASYFVSLLELLPFLKGHFPSWIGHGGIEFFGGIVSINILAPILLILLTVILCYGVKESSAANSFMTATKVVIVIVVIFAGAFEVDVSNWSPFAPNGFKAVITGATVVFFSYVGFDAVANSAEESKKPQRDLPIGILASLFVCAVLYIGVCLVITGMVPYKFLGEDAPLAEAFTAKGLKVVSVLISIGAVAGLATTLLVGLYSRLYLGLSRDGLLPSVFSKVHPLRHTPIHSQVWVGLVAGIMAGLFNVHQLSHILSVGTLTGYSVVSACVITLRWKDKVSSQVSGKCISAHCEGIICLVIIAFGGFLAGLCYRFSGSFIIIIFAVVMAILGAAAVQFRQGYADPPGFSCPGVPIVPVLSIFINIFLFAQLHEEAWYRFVIVSLISVGVYAIYGQYHANPVSSEHSVVYQGVPSEAA
ncbi:Amino acid permease [Musa troglodytarum]|uniref:Amino acid permease n=1 Tax=Musa troglodytarum TaxID=320322 RepID=A0A9E7JN76_9LILI|nr:Amino acid permease [Musa troglodytarum]